jgi:hypothetical protein
MAEPRRGAIKRKADAGAEAENLNTIRKKNKISVAPGVDLES